VDDAAARELAARGIPAVAGLATALTCVRAMRRPAGDPARLRAIAGAAAVARASSNGAGGDWLGEAAAKQLLREGGLPVPEGIELDPRDQTGCVAAAKQLGWPVALKLSGPAVRHKSDIGALALDIAGEAELLHARDRLTALPEADVARLLVERMADQGLELLVSARADAVVPVVTVGLGGVWTEALRDVAVIPLPTDAAQVAEGIRSLRGADLLSGGRGGEPFDIDAVADLTSRLGALLLERGLLLIELNPVVVHRHGCVAVDAVARGL
jgi:acyl-CoA synthetase (NDP forming)